MANEDLKKKTEVASKLLDLDAATVDFSLGEMKF